MKKKSPEEIKQNEFNYISHFSIFIFGCTMGIIGNVAGAVFCGCMIIAFSLSDIAERMK